MMMNHDGTSSTTIHDRVVGVMARAPLPGACKTRLAQKLGDDAAAELYQAMLMDTLAAYEELPLARRVLLAAPENDGERRLRELAPASWQVLPQRGCDLGKRLATAQAELRPGAVLLVSSDSPAPPIPGILEAFATWPRDGHVLLGPCNDGGYYLIGLPRPETRLFKGISWSTPRVVEQTRARCREIGVPHRLLPPAVDVDEFTDVALLEQELEGSPSLAPNTRRWLTQ